MLSFHNDPAIKKKYLSRVRAHAKADELTQGIGWSNGKGCAIGCTLEAYDHSRYPIELGIPQILARLEDRIFEGLSRADAQKWPARFLSAIRVGRDLSEVWPKFAIWLLRDVRKHARPDGKKAIDGVIGYFRLLPSERTFEKAQKVRAAASAASAADAAAAYAAYADAADADAADAAAYAAASAASAYAAASAADAAAYAASAAYADAADADAADAARKRHFKRQAEKLLELLRAA
jgi:hypothetical protein